MHASNRMQRLPACLHTGRCCHATVTQLPYRETASLPTGTEATAAVYRQQGPHPQLQLRTRAMSQLHVLHGQSMRSVAIQNRSSTLPALFLS